MTAGRKSAWNLAPATSLAFVLGLTFAVAASAQVHRTPERPAPAPEPGAIWPVLRLDCESTLGSRDVALFSDGVIRLREGPAGEEHLTLYDLDPDRLESFLTRLEQETPPDIGDLQTTGPGGQWVETCRLRLDLTSREPVDFSFRRYDALSLAQSRLVAIAREVGEIAEEALDVTALPPDYQPRSGDILERRDGNLFRVVRRTGDGGGLELQGVDQPLTLYIPLGALRSEFTSLVREPPP